MRLIVLFTLAWVGSVDANPRVIEGPNRHAYLASERLVIEVKPTEARLRGSFHFRFPLPADPFNRTNVAMCGVEVFLPKPPGLDSRETAFWKFFSVSNLTDSGQSEQRVQITADAQNVIRQFLDLDFKIAGREFPVKAFSVAPGGNAPELGSCSTWIWFAVPVALVSGNEPVIVSYRQPLHESESEGSRRFCYVPHFFGLPPEQQSSTTNRAYYSITVRASAECSLKGSNGRESFALQPGETVTLSPMHNRPICATVEPAICTGAGAVLPGG